ncbi:MAG: hypothetical protein Q9168_007926, partial [Polycauliona sp. 1 TL-2023]
MYAQYGLNPMLQNANSLSVIDQLTTQVCGPIYQANATESSTVSAAVAEATTLAIAATKGKDPADISNFPECA